MKFMDYFQNQPTSDEIIQKIKGYSSWIEIDLDNIGKNLETVKSISNSEVIPCIKKNAYAHGIAPITAYLMSKGVQTVLVAKLWEAKTIRRAGLDCGIINMDPIYTIDQYKWIVEQGISQVIYHYESAKKLNEIANQMNKYANIWIKVDTGLGRVGVNWSDAPRLIENISNLANINIEGIFSTLLEDEKDCKQIERLKEVKEKLSSKSVKLPKLSIASSHGIFLRPESSLDAVRPGVMLFGWYPTQETRKNGAELHQALSLKGRLEHVKWIDKGTPITYGGAFIAPRRMKVGTLHIGYSDGYLRQLSGKGLVKAKDKICPVIGGVTINHLVIDLTDTNAETGDIVEAISLTGANDVHSLCELAGLEPYQLAVWMSPITPRVYYSEKKPVAIIEPDLG